MRLVKDVKVGSHLCRTVFINPQLEKLNLENIMKTLKMICTATLMVLALSLPGNAGEITTPGLVGETSIPGITQPAPKPGETLDPGTEPLPDGVITPGLTAILYTLAALL